MTWHKHRHVMCRVASFCCSNDLQKESKCQYLYRPVGWSGDGGVRETMRVELTSGGGAFPVVWGSAVSSPIGVWGGAPAALQLLQC